MTINEFLEELGKHRGKFTIGAYGLIRCERKCPMNFLAARRGIETVNWDLERITQVLELDEMDASVICTAADSPLNSLRKQPYFKDEHELRGRILTALALEEV